MTTNTTKQAEAEMIAEMKRAALAATPQSIDTAQRIEHYDDGSHIECPACGGEGNVELEADFCNYDGTAIGVQFYGVGNAHGAAEAYLRAAMPANVLALIERLERAEAALLSASKPAAPAQSGERPDPKDIHGWSVTVNVNAQDILMIGHNSLSGIDNIEDFAQVVRDCAEHLLSFIGKPEESAVVLDDERADDLIEQQAARIAALEAAAKGEPVAYICDAGLAILEKHTASASDVSVWSKDHAAPGDTALYRHAAATDNGGGRDAWISVDERLPDEGQNVAFVVSSASPTFAYLNGRVLGGYFGHVAKHPTFSVPGLGLHASHWMPLPASPQSTATPHDGQGKA
ncbi:DUF551 domain-containing protein [Paraburkholderia sp. PREW-6R]|uniref:DUF551 domain-containing protein n=1 Tax=Paraburkholderia sp. PREW-6R TaxID=3141544 RepID=UPI0031F489DA